MSTSFDQNSISLTEFFVALPGDQDQLHNIPVTPKVTKELKQMLDATLDNLGAPEDWQPFECSEQYNATERLSISTKDPITHKVMDLFNAVNIQSNASVLVNDLSKVGYYFATFKDVNGNKCVAVKKAGQFKGVVDKPKLFLLNGQLDLVSGQVFRLDKDFDFVVFADVIAIYRPFFFESIADLDEAFKKLMPSLISSTSAAVSNIDFSFADELVQKSVRARKLMAAVSRRTDLHNLDDAWFPQACKSCNISITKKDGKWVPDSGQEVDFLEMLDRRRFPDPLVAQQPDNYRAAARKKV